MRNRKLICEWCYERGKADNVIEMIRENGKTYVVVNDYEKLRRLFGDMLREVQRIKSEGDYEAGKALVERFVLSPGIAFFLILRINQFFNAARQTTIQLFKIINFRRKLNLRIAVGFQISLKRLDGLSKLKNRAARIIVGKSLNTAGRR